MLSFRTDDEKTDSAAAVGVDFGVVDVGEDCEDVVGVDGAMDESLDDEETSREVENMFFLAPFPVRLPLVALSFND